MLRCALPWAARRRLSSAVVGSISPSQRHRIAWPGRALAYRRMLRYIDEQEAIPYATLNYLFASVNYGGRVTDYQDQRPADSILAKCVIAERAGYRAAVGIPCRCGDTVPRGIPCVGMGYNAAGTSAPRRSTPRTTLRREGLTTPLPTATSRRTASMCGRCHWLTSQR